MTGPTSSPVMVGRAAELQVLLDALAAGRAGHPRAVVVRGEAGIGKTRLLTEFLREAAAATKPADPPLAVATGQCVDLGTIGAPFTPIRRLLHELHSAVGDEQFRDAARTRAAIATLSALVPELDADADAVPIGSPDFVAESIERVIENLSADRHLLLVIEDLHWADAATLSLLKTLAVTLRGSHVTMVMTYRSDDVDRGHPLRAVLAELDRSRVVTSVEVARLTESEVREQVRLLSGLDDPDAVHAVASRSEGVPFFVEELLELDGAALPPTLRDVVLARHERLSESTRPVVGLASVGGVHVEYDVLEAVHAGDPDVLASALREAVSANVLVTDGDGYTFRHALIQEAVHDDLLPNERVRLHQRYAAALQARLDSGDRSVAAATAEHWLQARDVVRAFDATNEAHEYARETLAWTTAPRLGERLLELWPQVPDAEERLGMSSTRLTLAILDELAQLGEHPRLIRLARTGLADARPADRLGRGALHTWLAVAQFNMSRPSEALDDAEAAIELLHGLDDPEARGPLARAITITSVRPGIDERERRASGEHAIAIAEAGDADLLSRVLLNVAMSLATVGDWAQVHQLIDRVLAIDAPPVRRIDAISMRTATFIQTGRFADAVEAGAAGVALSAEFGMVRGSAADMLSNLAHALAAVGDVERAIPALRRAAELTAGTPPFRSFNLRTLALVHSWNDRFDLADEVRRSAAELIVEVCAQDAEERAGWAEFDAEHALNSSPGDPDGAFSALAAAETLNDPGARAFRWLTLILLPGAARACATAHALLLDAVRTAALRRSVDDGVALLDEPDRLRVEALVAAEFAEPSSAVAACEAAVASLQSGTMPVRHLYYARYRLAEALIEDGARDEASVLLAHITAEAPGHGVSLVARWARELAARAGIALEGTDAAPHAAASASGVSSLTPRELQVLALVAEGLTNPQIGQRLFISPKTASVHVSAILAKIGAKGRAEAAALYTAADAKVAP